MAKRTFCKVFKALIIYFLDWYILQNKNNRTHIILFSWVLLFDLDMDDFGKKDEV